MTGVSQLAPAARRNGEGLEGRVAVVIGDAQPFGADVGHALAARGARLVERIEDAKADLDILVFIASARDDGSLAATPAGEYSAGLAAGLKPAFLALQEAVAAIRTGGRGGAVVFVAPPAPSQRGYDAVQSGLRLLAKAAALELGPEGIRVNTVLPGAADAGAPLGRSCAPDDVANAVAFAASERARFMTGADLLVDGGRTIA
jgi:NAD(P)-dependent dehydrogenase (short-subunit alcohol dehydrogenase family)